MAWLVPLSDISFGAEEHEAVKRVLESGWISMGPETELFEEEFARSVGSSHAVATSSGTAALHLALHALGIGPGKEVVVPSLTFVATANAVLYVGASPVFADIASEDDWNISPTEIAKKLSPRTAAIVVMHYGGFPCQMDRIMEVADSRGVPVIEDAAHAPGAVFQGRSLGAWGKIGCFSFFANKNMTTAEGGMLVTDDDDLAKRVRSLRSHGMTTLTWDRHKGHSFSYDVTEMGYNFRMDEIRAALGRVQLARLHENNAARRSLTARMRGAFGNVPGIVVPFRAKQIESAACHIFPILLDSADARPRFMDHMKSAGVQTSIHYPPVHSFTAFRRMQTGPLPLTDEIAAREVTLPLFPAMTLEQAHLIVDAVCGFGAPV